ncbi:hypothetical protein CDEF62S_02151 [Castellaniella defragrans]
MRTCLHRLNTAVLVAMDFVSALAVFLIMLLVTANAISRFAFNLPVTGTLEFSGTLLVIVIFMALARTQHSGQNVRTLMLVKRLNPSWRRLFDLFCVVVGLVFTVLATWAFVLYTAQSFSYFEYEVGAIPYPLYPIKAVATLGLFLLAFNFLLQLLDLLSGGRLAALDDMEKVDAP